METKPVQNYKSPDYPKIEVVFSQPDILIKNMPKSWQRNKFIVTAMISFSLAACKAQADDTPIKKENIELSESTYEAYRRQIQNHNPDSGRIAPIFVHGDGVGASGCVMMAPPVYLSEEDALNIILGELQKEGILFNDEYNGDSITIKRKAISYNYDDEIENWADRVIESTESKKLFPDLYNKELDLLIEFVSFADYREFGDMEEDMCSVQSYYIKDAAEKIQKAYKDSTNKNLAVFYDPVGWPDEKTMKDRDWDKMEESGRENATKLLKDQVSDFIAWIKKEGMLPKE